jgi:hypothetical protein
MMDLTPINWQEEDKKTHMINNTTNIEPDHL